jgi:hypothetical protein
MSPAPAILAAAILLASCGGNQGAAPAGPAPAQSKEPAMPAQPVQTIDAATVQEAAAEGGIVALVQVEKAAIAHPGTRSESAEITCRVLTPVHGTPPSSLSLRRYTQKGDTVLAAGKVYMVAAFPDERFAPAMELAGSVPVADSQRAASVEAHRALIKKAP